MGSPNERRPQNEYVPKEEHMHRNECGPWKPIWQVPRNEQVLEMVNLLSLIDWKLCLTIEVLDYIQVWSYPNFSLIMNDLHTLTVFKRSDIQLFSNKDCKKKAIRVHSCIAMKWITIMLFWKCFSVKLQNRFVLFVVLFYLLLSKAHLDFSKHSNI